MFVRYCTVLQSIAWYCIVWHGIAWYCMGLHDTIVVIQSDNVTKVLSENVIKLSAAQRKELLLELELVEE